jgi:hypothetical protein
MGPSSLEDTYRFMTVNGFDGDAEGWSAGIDSLFVDSTGFSHGTSYLVANPHEFSPGFRIPLHDCAGHKFDLVDASVSIRNLDSLNHSLLVLSLSKGEEVVEWTAAPFSDYDPGTGEWYTVYHTFRPERHFRRHDLELKAYVWNREKESFLVDDFRVRVRPGNPIFYGLREKL